MTRQTVKRINTIHIYIAEKRLDKETKVNFKIYDVTDWTTKNYNKQIAQYIKK